MSVHRVDIDNLQGTSNSSGSTGVKKAQEEGGASNGQNGTTNVGVDGVGAKIWHTFYLGLSFFLSQSSILSTLFLLCSYPIRWFPVPSVIAPSPRSPTLSGTCQCTRRPGLGCIFLFGAGRWWNRTPASSVGGGFTSCTTCRGTWPRTRPRTRCQFAKLIISNQSFH